MRKKIIFIYALILGIGIPYYFLVSKLGVGIPCPIYELTGFLCGSCGVSRMFISMIEFRMSEAFRYNCVWFVLFFVWNLIALLIFIGKPGWIRSRAFLSKAAEVSVFILFLFMILRNIF